MAKLESNTVAHGFGEEKTKAAASTPSLLSLWAKFYGCSPKKSDPSAHFFPTFDELQQLRTHFLSFLSTASHLFGAFVESIITFKEFELNSSLISLTCVDASGDLSDQYILHQTNKWVHQSFFNAALFKLRLRLSLEPWLLDCNVLI